MAQAKSIRVLMVEDQHGDVLLVVRELERAGYRVDHRPVQSAETFRQALLKETWDLIICDFLLPNFSAPAAWKIHQEEESTVPFVVVSGNIDDELAGLTLNTLGVSGLVMKDRIEELPAVVARLLQKRPDNG